MVCSFRTGNKPIPGFKAGMLCLGKAHVRDWREKRGHPIPLPSTLSFLIDGQQDLYPSGIPTELLNQNKLYSQTSKKRLIFLCNMP